MHVYLQINPLAQKEILFVESLQLNGVENKACQKLLSDKQELMTLLYYQSNS